MLDDLVTWKEDPQDRLFSATETLTKGDLNQGEYGSGDLRQHRPNLQRLLK